MLSLILNISITETVSSNCRYIKKVRKETCYKIFVLRQFIYMCSVEVGQQVLLTFGQIAPLWFLLHHLPMQQYWFSDNFLTKVKFRGHSEKMR